MSLIMKTGFVFTFASKARAVEAFKTMSASTGKPAGMSIAIGQCTVKEIGGWNVIEPFWVMVACDARDMEFLDT